MVARYLFLYGNKYHLGRIISMEIFSAPLLILSPRFNYAFPERFTKN